MKRTGERGLGEFERISWDEAIQTIVDKLKYTIDTYGNDAIFVNYATGMYSATGKTVSRLLNCIGGSLPSYGDYSTGMMQYVMPFMFGMDATPYDNVNASSVDQAAKADLVIQFGNSAADTRMGGANVVWDYCQAREAMPNIIHIDYRYNEQMAGFPEEWVPIRTGTDAALVAGIAHKLIKNNWIDLNFLHAYCQGYDEETMPESAKGQNKSYYDYIMGAGYDRVEKTPEWAAEITLVPPEKIREIAQRIHEAKNVFVAQGWGLQRHNNGESATRAVCMLALLTGNVGREGTNAGWREAEPPGAPVGSIPNSDTDDPNGVPANPVSSKKLRVLVASLHPRGRELQPAMRGSLRVKNPCASPLVLCEPSISATSMSFARSIPMPPISSTRCPPLTSRIPISSSNPPPPLPPMQPRPVSSLIPRRWTDHGNRNE